jgi:hypothetical protein
MQKQKQEEVCSCRTSKAACAKRDPEKSPEIRLRRPKGGVPRLGDWQIGRMMGSACDWGWGVEMRDEMGTSVHRPGLKEDVI